MAGEHRVGAGGEFQQLFAAVLPVLFVEQRLVVPFEPRFHGAGQLSGDQYYRFVTHLGVVPYVGGE